MMTVLLGLLCRHDAVGEDTVSEFGVLMLVLKVYHVLMSMTFSSLSLPHRLTCFRVNAYFGKKHLQTTSFVIIERVC